MREQNKTKRWRERMPYAQAVNIERAIRDIARNPVYIFALGKRATSRIAGLKGNSTRMAKRLVERLIAKKEQS